MPATVRPVYEFGPWRLDTAQRLLLRGGQPVPGHLVLDPDGQGFVFRPDGAPLADGEYEMVVRTGSGAFGPSEASVWKPPSSPSSKAE